MMVSVIIPAHNEEKYVVRCIRSIKRAVQNASAFVKMALGNGEEYDKLIDKMFYDYND